MEIAASAGGAFNDNTEGWGTVSRVYDRRFDRNSLRNASSPIIPLNVVLLLTSFTSGADAVVIAVAVATVDVDAIADAVAVIVVVAVVTRNEGRTIRDRVGV